MPATSDAALGPRRRRFRRWLLLVASVVAVQSITVTLPITVRYVAAESGAPLSQLPVTAVWRMEAAHLAGSLPATVLKVQRLVSNQDGEVRLGLAVMLHAPNFPFGPNMRSARLLPTLHVADERYEARLTADDPFDPKRPAPLRLLSLQRTSIDGVTVVLAREPADDAVAAGNREDMRYLVSGAVYQAEELCRQRWLCQED